MARDASSSLRTFALLALGAGCVGACAPPVLSRDGQLVFQQSGARGASVITANGVEFLDRTDLPAPVLRRSVNEPFRAPTGFLLPRDGVLRHTSSAVPVQGKGLLVLLRPSDVLVPSWGGEILLRLDAIVPKEAFPHAKASIRAPHKVVLVLDGVNANTLPLVAVALDNAGQRDRIAIVDSANGRAVMPLVPGSDRTLVEAAVERILEQNQRTKGSGARHLAAALGVARGFVGTTDGEFTARRVVVVSDGIGVRSDPARVAAEAAAVRAAGANIVAIGAPDDLDAATLAPLGSDVHAATPFAERENAVAVALPPAGDVVLNDVVLSVSSVPAPAHVIEVSGGTAALELREDLVMLGDLVVGEARTEMARVSLPTWVPGEPLELTVTARYRDAHSGTAQTATATVRCRYSNDVEEIANARNGDVIAYASALAMVRRLHRAFAGNTVDRLGGIRPIVALQAKSMGVLARAQRDSALATQSEVLNTLLGTLED